jgi:hypothetical protein
VILLDIFIKTLYFCSLYTHPYILPSPKYSLKDWLVQSYHLIVKHYVYIGHQQSTTGIINPTTVSEPKQNNHRCFLL